MRARGPDGHALVVPTSSSQPMLAKRLAQDRTLDQRPYRGDYDRVGKTTRDAWGGFVSGEGECSPTRSSSRSPPTTGTTRFQDMDTDFTPELFRDVQGDKAWQTYDELKLERRARGGAGRVERRRLLPARGPRQRWHDPVHPARTALSRYSAHLQPGHRQLRRPGASSAGTSPTTSRSKAACDGTGSASSSNPRKIGGLAMPSDSQRSRVATWQTPTGQLILTYHFNADKVAYAQVHARLQGGPLQRARVETEPIVGGPSACRGETGVQRRLGGRPARVVARAAGSQLAGSVFYYRYQNYQIFLFTDSADQSEPPVLEIVNAKQAENFGAELEGTLRAAARLGAAPALGASAVRELQLAARRVHRLLDLAQVRHGSQIIHVRGRLLRRTAPERARIQARVAPRSGPSTSAASGT